MTRRLAAALLLIASLAGAEPSKVLEIQGRLADASGLPMPGTTSVTLELFTAASGGTSRGAETQDVSADAAGRFQAFLGDQVALDPAHFSGPLFLEVTAGGAALSPRIPLRAAPYAAVAHGVGRLLERSRVVSHDGDDGASADALNLAIVDAGSDATAAKRATVIVGPGTYDFGLSGFGFTYLDVYPFVTVQGSGQGVTVIRGATFSNGAHLDEGGVIRDLTIEVDSQAAVFGLNGPGRLEHVELVSVGDGSGPARGYVLGNTGGAIVDSTIRVSDPTGGDVEGIYVLDAAGNGAAFAVEDCTVEASSDGGAATGLRMNSASGNPVRVTGSRFQVDAAADLATGILVEALSGAQVEASSFGVSGLTSAGVTIASTATVELRSSRVEGPLSAGSGAICGGRVADESFAAMALAACP